MRAFSRQMFPLVIYFLATMLALTACEYEDYRMGARDEGVTGSVESTAAAIAATERKPTVGASLDFGYLTKIARHNPTDDADGWIDEPADESGVDEQASSASGDDGQTAVDDDGVPLLACETAEHYSVNAGSTIKVRFQDRYLAIETLDLRTEVLAVQAPAGTELGQAGTATAAAASTYEVVYQAPKNVQAEVTVAVRAVSTEPALEASCSIRVVPSQGLALADDGKTRGLVGNLFDLENYIPPGTSAKFPQLPRADQRLPDFDEMTAVGTVVIPNFDVPTRNFMAGFPGVSDRFEWFGLRFDGEIIIAASGEVKFRLGSDDGSKLYIDADRNGIDPEDLVIDNDGTHAYRAINGAVTLPAGSYPIRVDYYQGPRVEISLELFWNRPDAAKWTKVPPDAFRRPLGPGETPALADAGN